MKLPDNISPVGKIMKPQEGFQTDFSSANVDVIFGGGILGGGKTFAAILAMAEFFMTDPDFRALMSRRSLQNTKVAGGFVDKFKTIFGDYCTVKESDSPRITFPNGAYCDLTYIDDRDINALKERAKGWEYDVIATDELTEMTWAAFSYLQTRNRGRSRKYTGKFFAMMNPKRSHWVRTFIDWYIGADGRIIPERSGRVRYFFIYGDTVNDVAWGDSKEEVYEKCKIQIDEKLQDFKEIGMTYKDIIKSFVFYLGKLSENKTLLENNRGYIGSIAASGGRQSKQLLEGNWNVDPDEEEDAPLKGDDIRNCFISDPARNGDKWITVDLASEGNDNLVALLWDGFHCYGKLVKSDTTPQGNANLIKAFAAENGVSPSHIIFDAINGAYFNDYIPDALPYKSSRKPFGMYKDTALTIKDMCYLRLCQMIRDGNLTFDERVYNSYYTHKNLSPITMQNEIMEELSVIRFDEQSNGKKKLWPKKKMNYMLGKQRSMDVADPCAMRMLPCAGMEYGNELDSGIKSVEVQKAQGYAQYEVRQSIYDETFWC